MQMTQQQDKSGSHVAGAWSERKKNVSRWIFFEIGRLRIQKLKIGRLADFEKIEFENFTL